MNGLGVGLGIYGLMEVPAYRWISAFVVALGTVNIVLWIRRRRREREDL